MRRKIKPYFNLIIIIFLSGFIFINKTRAEEKIETTQIATQKTSDSTRIVISTSGPVKFNSHWLDNPYRLILEFKSRNVIGNVDKEMVVNQGVIRKITSTYFGSGRNKMLKTLTFELSEKVPYKIWQEGNSILLDIQAPLETPGFSVDTKETVVKNESSDMIKRLEAIDVALKQTQENQPSSMVPGGIQETNRTVKHVASTKADQGKVVLAEPIKVRKKWLGIILWFAGLVSISGLGFALWRKYVVVRTKNLTERIRELNLQLEKKDKLLEQVEIIHKAIQKTAIEKEKECAQLKETSESLKDVLVKRGIARQLTLPEEKGELWILGKSQERRSSPRLTLTKDFHNTVILKIELQGISGNIKSFAENISSVGLCFETTKELDDKHPINLRLFFYGGRVPIMKVQGRIVWKKIIESSNYYGLCFDWLGEKEKLEINSYIESNLPRG